MAGAVTRRDGRGDRRPPRRVVLVSKSDGLIAVLRHVLGQNASLTRFTSLPEALERDGLEDADVIVLDLPRDGGDTVVARLRHHYRGDLVVLAERGHGRRRGAPGPAVTLLERPFSTPDLAWALGLASAGAGLGAGPQLRMPRPIQQPPAAPAAPAHPVPAAAQDVKAAARRAPSWSRPGAGQAGRAGMAARAGYALAMLTQGWQGQRRVRVAGFSVIALVAFAIAFALASKGHCGPGCDALGTAFAPRPTIAPSESSAPSTTRDKRSTTTTATAARTATSSARVASGGGRLVTTTTTTHNGEREATTTTRKPSPGGGEPPATTRPPATTAPPTTAASTTAPPTTAPTTTQPPAT